MIQVDENPLIDALDALDQGLLWLDPDLRVLRHNHAYRCLLELDNPDQFIGQPYSDVLEFLLKRGEFLYHDDEGVFIASRMRAMRAGQPYRIRRLRPNGTLLSVAAKPLTSGGYVFTYLDVTSEAQALEEIQRATKATVVAMANFAEHRDTDTGVHVLRVARLVGQTAHALMVDGQFPANINPTFIETAHVASILHDLPEKRRLEIARALAISPNTVKIHVSGILARLGLPSRTQAIHWMLTRNAQESPAADTRR